MSTGPKICCAGEVMIEFAATGKGHQYSQGFAGDSYNTAHAWSADHYTRKQARQVTAIDTTGAGDSFNAGYLAARLQDLNIDTAIERAQQLAARVVQHRGAVIAAGL